MSRILVFDSGIGGLSVLAEIRRTVPGAALVYVADDAAFPYGDWDETALHDHVIATIGRLIEQQRPDLVVIACNTASTLVLPSLRGRFKIPFVGTVPAIKPAAERTRSGLVSVLATPGTMKRDYTRDLIRSFAGNCHVRLVGSALLAPLAEAHMRGEKIDEAAVAAEAAPAFLEVEGRRTDTVVLACTHYPFLLPLLDRLAPWPVDWIDPAPAIARRVASVMADAGLSGDAGGAMVPGPALLTSGSAWAEPLRPTLRSLGLDPEAAAAGAV